MPRKRRAVFIDSEFWHGKDYRRILNSRPADDYWVKKIARNMERDKEVRLKLDAMGWQVCVVWEADIKRKALRDTTLQGIADFLRN